LKPISGEGKGFVVARNIDVVDALEASLFKLKPQTVYRVYVGGQRTPVAAFKTDARGMTNGTAIGPLREAITSLSAREAAPSRIIVMEGDTEADPSKAVLVSAFRTTRGSSLHGRACVCAVRTADGNVAPGP
jgi:hypothetical protein